MKLVFGVLVGEQSSAPLQPTLLKTSYPGDLSGASTAPPLAPLKSPGSRVTD